MAIALRYAARSDVGLVRSVNQDSGYAGPHLLVLADGMGGHAGGDVASSITIGELVDLDGESHGGDDALELLATRLRSANEALERNVHEHPELRGMGTTVIALLRTGNKLAMAHIGDSRAFLLREGTLTQITKDHSFVQSLVDEGRISAEEAEHHPQRSIVTRVLTGQPDDEPDLSLREARPGDRYLICSDGLSDFVARDTIAEVMASGMDADHTADRLVELALKAGAPDNVTVIIGDVVDLDRAEAPSTVPQVVGAAAERQAAGTRPLPQTPAAKAAALSRTAAGDDEDAEDDGSVTLAEEGPKGARKWLRRGGLMLLVLAVVMGGGYAAYDWSQRQYFVGESGGFVAIYRGVSQNIGPLKLSHVETATDVDINNLPDFYRSKVNATFNAESLTAARKIVDDLRSEAVSCEALKAKGQSCGAAS
ncbi:MAG: Stp1/IreP family PP2C-type Ser/Thr phosphatase [Oryzihumus sp.]